MSLINSYGVQIKHRPAALPMTAAPWKTAPAPPPESTIKGLIQRIRPDSNTDLPEGRLKAVMVLLIKSGSTPPRPGDRLDVDQQCWRISTILPLASDRRQSLVEALVTLAGETTGETQSA
jgi:hypothetical protein